MERVNPVEEVFSQVKHWNTMNDTVFQSTQDPRILLTMAFKVTGYRRVGVAYVKTF